jgi:hypothetical protein
MSSGRASSSSTTTFIPNSAVGGYGSVARDIRRDSNARLRAHRRPILGRLANQWGDGDRPWLQWGGTPPGGAPCPGAPSVTYRCPVDGVFHEISLTSSSGDSTECLQIQVLYRGPADQYNPAQFGPSMYVCLSGSKIEWPADKVKAWEDCLAALWGKLRQYAELAHVNPGDPVEFLASLPAALAIRLQAGVETLEHLDASAQPQLAKAIKDEVLGILRARTLGPRRARECSSSGSGCLLETDCLVYADRCGDDALSPRCQRRLQTFLSTSRIDSRHPTPW